MKRVSPVNVQSLLFWPLRPLWRLFLRVTPAPRNAWTRVNGRVAPRSFGPGSTHDFAWYFQGESTVGIATVDDVQDWLLACEYVSDPDLFRVSDFWQHPCTFEQVRRGDCEDHALWAWRKLVELGYDAELVMGRFLPWTPSADGAERTHVWVTFRRDGETYVFETTCKVREQMVRRLTDVSAKYRPELGVDRQRKSFAFAGALVTMREREFAR